MVFGGIVEKVMQSPKSEIYTDVEMRGVTGHGYFTPINFGPYNSKYARVFFVGIPSEGQHAEKLMKSQLVSKEQLTKLEKFNKIDEYDNNKTSKIV